MLSPWRCSPSVTFGLSFVLFSLILGAVNSFLVTPTNRPPIGYGGVEPTSADTRSRHGGTRHGAGNERCAQPCRAESRQSESESIDRREILARAWKAALSLSAATVALSTTGAPPATAGWLGLPFGDDGAEQTPLPAIPEVSKEISYDDFSRALLKGQIQKCDFYGAGLSTAIVSLADGTEALIGEGYPQERAFSDDSPMKVVAVLRNAGVPFTTQFNVSSYSRPTIYKSDETKQAEERQRVENETLDRLMSE